MESQNKFYWRKTLKEVYPDEEERKEVKEVLLGWAVLEMHQRAFLEAHEKGGAPVSAILQKFRSLVNNIEKVN